MISAIGDASEGDLNKMAGAADFCHLLVETMEMGMTTLVTATFHYCECYVAKTLDYDQPSLVIKLAHNINNDNLYETKIQPMQQC